MMRRWVIAKSFKMAELSRLTPPLRQAVSWMTNAKPVNTASNKKMAQADAEVGVERVVVKKGDCAT
jgi:hypothetical protein